jgi:hypothetical protein
MMTEGVKADTINATKTSKGVKRVLELRVLMLGSDFMIIKGNR